jgi:hypothetical protein
LKSGCRSGIIPALMNFELQSLGICRYQGKWFLNSANPEEIILAVLGDFGNEKPETALTQIIKRLEETKTDQTTLQKHFRQLRILVKLRKLDLIQMLMAT